MTTRTADSHGVDISFALDAQRGEITEHKIYSRLAKRMDGKNRKILERIAADELTHYGYWRQFTKRDVAPRSFVIWVYVLLARIFGVIFALKIMEGGESRAQDRYAQVRGVEGIERIIRDEHKHEDALITLLHDERLEYASSIVLGLNDALVELTGALAGMTLALRDGTLVAVAGLVTGIAASFSMAASGYLSSKEEKDSGKNPLKSAVYTGVTYLITVCILIAPYFLLGNIYLALAVTLVLAVSIIAAYTFYITTAKELRFWPRFLEMAGISLSVAAITFCIGWALNHFLGIGA